MLLRPHKYEVARSAAILGIIASLLFPVVWLLPKLFDPVSSNWMFLRLVPHTIGFAITIWKLSLIVKDPAVNILRCSRPLVWFFFMIQINAKLDSVIFLIQSILIALWIIWIVGIDGRGYQR